MTRPSKGAVAAGHRLTVEAAADVLRDGGNAVDAAVAGLWMACVCEPVLTSPGGGGFLMARDGASGESVLYDFFAQTPRNKKDPSAIEFLGVHADFGAATQEFHIGHGAAATPGFVPGLFAVADDLGSLPMARLLAPAVAAARDGIEMTAFQAFLSQVVKPILTTMPAAAELFAPGGEVVPAGADFANPGLADFYQGLSHDGLDFYEQEAVPAFCAELSAHGQLRDEDFASYQVLKRAPLSLDVGGASVALNPPPSRGGAFIAHALSGLDAADGHLATALANADATRIRLDGDAARILADAGISHDGQPSAGPVGRGTTHISVIDGEGNAASATVSNGSGNGQLVGGYGFMLNNMLGEADLNRGGFHTWAPDLRLSSNMCPAISCASDGTLVAIGSGGSNRIRSSVFQVLARMIRDGMSPQDAVHAPRVHVEDGHLDFEDDMDEAEAARLRKQFPDHLAWPDRNLFFGGVHVVRRGADGSFDAEGDARRGGVAVVV